MFKATKDIELQSGTIKAGDEVQNPTIRMIELGLVVEMQEVKKEKPNKEKVEKVEKVAKVEKNQTPKEEILTEQSSNVSVEKTEEKNEE